MQKVEFLLVGGYALAFHGAPRFTEDIDLMVLVSPEKADKQHTVRVCAQLGTLYMGFNSLVGIPEQAGGSKSGKPWDKLIAPC